MSSRIQLIAEIGQAHDGSLGLLHSYIDALKDTGVDAVKFQTHIAEAESSSFEQFRVKFSYVDATRFDYWKRMSFTPEQWAGIKAHCEDNGMEFMSSPFSNAAVDLLEKLNVKRYKIGSGEVTNLLMLQKIARTGKQVILSSGMNSYEEIDEAVKVLKAHHCDISILQCTTAYPTQPEQWGLNVLGELKQRYGVPVGFSDHSGSIYACLAAASLGAELLEFHVVFDKKMFGPDASSSLTPAEIRQLAEGVRQVERALAHPVDKTDTSAFTTIKNLFEKSLSVNRPLKAGETITLDDLEAKKPKGQGIPAHQYAAVAGKTMKRDIGQWEFLNEEDLQP
jgi:N,N'-diacetyllegionaminate synthase